MSYADYLQKLEEAQRRQDELYQPPPAQQCDDMDDSEPPSSMNQEHMMQIVRERLGKRAFTHPTNPEVRAFLVELKCQDEKNRNAHARWALKKLIAAEEQRKAKRDNVGAGNTSHQCQDEADNGVDTLDDTYIEPESEEFAMRKEYLRDLDRRVADPDYDLHQSLRMTAIVTAEELHRQEVEYKQALEEILATHPSKR